MEFIVDHAKLEPHRAKCDVILDVRSPAEYDEDHLRGALNIPVLDDGQRAEVGTIYKTNPFEAKKVGAHYATAAISDFLGSTVIKDADKKTHFLVYCARGGQRSGALATVLNQIGFSVHRLKRGYKTYRAHVLEMLSLPLPQPVFVLYGYTGSSKTEILKGLTGQVNVLDLEGCARHRGSILGPLPGIPQPTQRGFETEILETIRKFDPSKPTLVEGESRMIGHCSILDGLWTQMNGGHHFWLEVPRHRRVENILLEYKDLKQPDYLQSCLEKLSRYLPGKELSSLEECIAEKQWYRFVEELLVHHYDPLYHRSLKRSQKEIITQEEGMDGLDLVRRKIEERSCEKAQSEAKQG